MHYNQVRYSLGREGLTLENKNSNHINGLSDENVCLSHSEDAANNGEYFMAIRGKQLK